MKEIWLVAIEVEDVIPNSLGSLLDMLGNVFAGTPFKALVGQIEWREDMRPITLRKGKVIEVGEPVARPSNGDLLDQFHELAARRK